MQDKLTLVNTYIYCNKNVIWEVAMELKHYDYIVGILSSLIMIASPISIKYTLDNFRVHVKRHTD